MRQSPTLDQPSPSRGLHPFSISHGRRFCAIPYSQYTPRSDKRITRLRQCPTAGIVTNVTCRQNKLRVKRHSKPVLLWTPRGFQLQNPLAVSARIDCFKKNLFQYRIKIQWNLHGLTNKLVAYTRLAHLHTAEKETNEWRIDYVFDPFPISQTLWLYNYITLVNLIL